MAVEIRLHSRQDKKMAIDVNSSILVLMCLTEPLPD